ncbi:sulfite reductase subunit alpha [Pseudomonas cichorii]|uniref:flavodoxin domain-containing protein n=1 Tax=Pseudomonas cichorii TaxID=36746 RepID=UPI00191051D1|nr:sulfite reductase flavoprotein subunit alpha [Pseudomonas cichorii]GFM84616.1 sulfite reductase subunit alpha [Pseudomonas cichorii]
MNVERVFIGYGSESGNARGLAQRLECLPFLQRYAPQARELNSLDLEQMTATDLLLVVSSSFGDGEPPANAERFLEQAVQASNMAGLRYAIFGLGDTAYPTFCGFTRTLDTLLSSRNAMPVINRVDADTDFEGFFATWSRVLDSVLQGDSQAGATLHLQVVAYGEKTAYPASILEQRRLNQSPPYAHHIRFNIQGSGIKYRAGDNLYVLAENAPEQLAALARWFDDEQARTCLANKELRQIGKSVLRDIAKASGNDELKSLLKISHRKLLDEYLHGKDILDVLDDFCEPGCFTVQELAHWLPDNLPRAYSIASHSHPDYVDLCIREVAYSLAGRERKGTATGFLTGQPQAVNIFARSNPRFHLPDGVSHPLILIGTGTGIAPLIGLLEQLENEAANPTTCLVFGDRHQASDFLYRERIEHWQTQGVLDHVLTAFSRDNEARYYVQDALVEHSHIIWDLLNQGAHLYLCGNKANLECSICEALVSIARSAGRLDIETAEGFVRQLLNDGRIHKELY